MTFSRKLACLISLWVIGSSAHATLLWDETVDGDLPNILFADQVSPNLTLLEGIAAITVSRSGVTPVSAPGTLFLVGLALASLIRRQS